MLVILLMALAACGGDRSQAQRTDSTPERDGLVVVGGGTGVQRVDEYDGVVRYTVREPYPATHTLDAISTVLKNSGWQPVQEDLLNPGVRSSHERGWTDYEQDDRHVFQWLAAWRNNGGDVVQYTLRYRVKGNTAPTGSDATVEVIAIHMTAKTLGDFKRQMRDVKPR
jgi:hypothetical protein